MARSKSSGRWLAEHFHDEYVKLAQEHGYRSRAVFKLKEIQERDGLLTPGMNVLDLGAAPGGWSQYAMSQVGVRGKVIALDILPMEDLPGVTFIQGDFRDDVVVETLNGVLAGARIDVVLSDMAPNLSGNKAVDQPRSLFLAELALETARNVLDRGGAFLVKLFQGSGSEQFQKDVKQSFDKTFIRKPRASRARSCEVYLLGRGFK
ncbi:MAG: 23S rRNA (uridine(2552)-2'-O)-methyltransferase RlmE [Pseudomonadota bacterium]